MLLYSQNRTGYTFAAAETAEFQAQLYWNWNVTVDVKAPILGELHRDRARDALPRCKPCRPCSFR